MEQKTQDLKVGLKDFRDSNWKAAIVSCKREGYRGIFQSFSDAANAAEKEGNISVGKVLGLLSAASSMLLNPGSDNEPFKPYFVFDGKRAPLPEDFQQSDVEFFSLIVEEVDEAWLQARLADLLWLLITPRNHKFAIMAVDSYRKIPLEKEIWRLGAQECWSRAIHLTRMLGKGESDRLKEIETAIISKFDSVNVDDGLFALWLSDLLETNHLGSENASDLAEKLEALAKAHEAQGELYHSREMFAAASRWFKHSGDNDKAAEMTVYEAESWVKEAVARMSSDQPSNMVAASFYESAIQTYRSIPRKNRSAFNVEERLDELQKKIYDSNTLALDEMTEISSHTIDITQLIEMAQEDVKGKSPIEALSIFANIHHGAQVCKLRDFSKKILRDYPFQAIISSSQMSRDGRIIAKRPGVDLGNTESESTQKAIWAEMVKHHTKEISLIVQGHIWPALEIITLEHRLRENDFVTISRQSPIVPKGRASLFGKALYAGYDFDFVSALHILIPQIEHMVRWHLKNGGIKTTNLDQNGIENENGLSALMDLPETTQIFGEDLVFDIKAVFCDAFGPNLRNNLAHGLIEEPTCHSASSVYAWWLGLKMVFNTFWNTTRSLKAEKHG